MLVAAGITACGGDTDRDPTARGGSGGSGTADAGVGGAGSGGLGGSGGVIVVTGGTAGISGSGGSNEPCYTEQFLVEVPPEGVPAEPGQICAANADPVESYRAARVTLTNVPGDPQAVTGHIELDDSVAADVVGLPVVEVVEATHPSAAALTVSELLPDPAGGFNFRATWAAPVTLERYYEVRVSIRTQLTLRCAPDSSITRRVHALTEVYQCVESGSEPTPIWVSSGDTCIVCRIIAEMAPSPIVPDKQADELPLAKALRLRIVELARVSNTVVLLAENDGGEGLDYEWHPSEGRLEQLAPDVVAWTLEPGARGPIIQVAVMGDNTAAVASRSFYEAA